MTMSNGLTFNQLPEASSVDEKSDLMLISHWNEKTHKYESMAITIDSLVSQLNADMDDNIKIGEIAYMSKDDFALSSHDHDIYTKASYNNTLQYSGEKFTIIKFNDMTSLAPASEMQISVNTQSDLLQRWKDAIDNAQPKIGTIQMLAISSLPPGYTSDPEISDFNGWVPADGTTYDLSDFEQSVASTINELYGDGNGTTFTVPDLNGFFKIHNNPDIGCSLQMHEHYTALPRHTHAFDVKNAKIVVDNLNPNDISPKSIKLDAWENAHYWKYRIHCGKSQDKSSDVVTFTCQNNVTKESMQDTNININEQPAISTQPNDNAAYPAFNYVPAFVYVGRSKNSTPLYEVVNQ